MTAPTRDALDDSTLRPRAGRARPGRVVDLAGARPQPAIVPFAAQAPADRPMHPPANPGFRGRPKSGRLGDVMSYPCPAGMYSALSTSCPPAMPHFVRVVA